MGVAELALWTPDYYLAHPSPSAWLAALGGLSLRLAGRRARTQPVPAAGAVPLPGLLARALRLRGKSESMTLQSTRWGSSCRLIAAMPGPTQRLAKTANT